jgi:hypothetical protein
MGEWRFGGVLGIKMVGFDIKMVVLGCFWYKNGGL